MGYRNTPKKKAVQPYRHVGFKDLPICQKVMTILLWVVVGTILLLTLTGCSGKQKITQQSHYVHDTTIVERRVVDTLVRIEPDTASATMLVECDENNKAMVSTIEALQGKLANITPIVKYIKVKDENGVEHTKALINVNATIQAQELQIKMLEEKVQSGRSENELLYREYKKEKSRWYTWMIMGIAVGMFGMCLIRLILK